MKNILKIILIVIALSLITGCGDKTGMEKSYKKMQIGKGIDSYQLDLRVYGTVDNKKISELIKIDNYKNQQLRISNTNIGMIKQDAIINNDLYIIGNKQYRQNKDKKYEEVKNKEKYIDSSIYLEAIKNVGYYEERKTETIGSNTYKVYQVTVKKKLMNSILKGTNIDYKVSKDHYATVWLDKNNYVYKIVYNIEEDNNKITLNAAYFRINSIREIKSIIEA